MELLAAYASDASSGSDCEESLRVVGARGHAAGGGGDGDAGADASAAAPAPPPPAPRVVKRPPALPASFLAMEHGGARKRARGAEDRAAHGGRVRQVPHVEGNWPSYVYLAVPCEDDVRASVSAAFARVRASREWTRTEDMHVSVSRLFMLRAHELRAFRSALETALRDTPRFDVLCESTREFANDDQTRTFFAMCVDTGSDDVAALIARVDKVVRAFGHRPFYTPAEPHFSTHWALGAEHVQHTRVPLDDEQHVVPLRVDRVFVKTGNVVTTIALRGAE